jgi:hypothetical protein
LVRRIWDGALSDVIRARRDFVPRTLHRLKAFPKPMFVVRLVPLEGEAMGRAGEAAETVAAPQ